MADNVATQYVYPPNWGGELPEPGKGGYKRVVLKRNCKSDGTGETDAILLNISEWQTASGDPVKRTKVEWIKGYAYGMRVMLEWDREEVDAKITVLDGAANPAEIDLDFRREGGLVDPGEADVGTGNIVITTEEATDGDTYEIMMSVVFKGS